MRSAADRPLIAFYVFLLLGFLLPLLMLRGLEMRAFGAPMGMAWLVILFASFKLSSHASVGERRLLSLSFWVFVYVWLGVAPLAQFATDVFPLAGVYSTSTSVFAFVLILAGIIAYEIGHGPLQRRISSEVRLGSALTGRRLRSGKAVAIGLLAVLASGGLILTLGGLSIFLTSRADFFNRLREWSDSDGQATLQVVLRLVQVPTFVSWYVLWFLWVKARSRQTTGMRVVGILLLLVLGAINVTVNNPVSNARYWFGTIVLSVAFVTIPWKRSASFAAWALGLIAVLLFVFPYTDVFRHDIEPSAFEYRGMQPLVDKGDYDGFQQVMNSVVYVEENGLSFGRQIFGTALFWVPRSMWPEKPLPSSEIVAANYGYRYTNLSLPLWGEAYLDGGILFVLVFFVAYGALSGFVERLYLASTSENSLLECVVPVVAAYQPFLLRGTLMSTFAYLVPVLVMLIASTSPARRAGRVMDGYRVGARAS